MAYSTMTTRSAGYVVPASEWNQLISNDEACAVASFTTKGDMFAATASKAGVRLAAGANYWGPTYLSTNANGLAVHPQRTILKSAGYQRVVNSTAWTNACTVSIPGGFLGTNQSILYSLEMDVLNNKGSNGVINVQVSYGTSLLTNNFVNWQTWDYGASRGWFGMRAIISACGATNAQKGMMYCASYENGSVQNFWAQMTPGAFTEDSTGALTAAIYVQMDAAHANFEFTCLRATIEACPVGTLV